MNTIPAQNNNRRTVSHLEKEPKSKPFNIRTYAMLQVGGAVHSLTRQAFRKQKFTNGQIIADWVNIIGSHYGNLTYPYRIAHDTLTIACASTTATELQYIAHTIIEKINLYYGKKVISHLKFIYQRNAKSTLTKSVKKPLPMIHPVTITALSASPLQEALAKLGGHIQNREKGKI